MGSIVPGKLANFTILADNPVTIDPLKIKDFAVWGTVQEGRVLPVTRAGARVQATLGPVVDEASFAVARADARPGSHDGHGHAAGDSYTAARAIAAAVAMRASQ